MLKSYIWLLIGAYLVISTQKVLGQRPKKCAEFNEYCQMHSDCCSKSCLTYLYKCTRNYNGVYPYTFFGEKYPAAGTMDDVIAFTFSNFGNIEEMKRHQTNTQQMPQRPYGFGTRFSDAAIGGDDEHLHDEAVVSEAPTTESAESTTTTQKPQENDVKDKESNNVRDNVVVETRATNAAADCKAIGLKCYTHDECCTKRCHGFLHQCVT